ncbi:MAG: tetratricopeptide repeat protein [Rhodothermales bacterium]
MKRTSVLFAVVSMLFMSTGCNVFESFYRDGSSDDPEVLLDDARYALQNGDPDKAVALLEKAYAKDSTDPEIRVELSSALFQANDIDLLLMKDLAEFISEDAVAGSGKWSGAPPACTFEGSSDGLTEIRFADEAAFIALFSNRDVLDRAIALLGDLLETEVDLDPNQLSNAHLMHAISMMATMVLDIQGKADELGATLYRVSQNGIGYCAPDQHALQALQSYIVCEKVLDIDAAIDDLAIRQELLGSTENELLDLLQSAREDFISSITASCGIDIRVTG